VTSRPADIAVLAVLVALAVPAWSATPSAGCGQPPPESPPAVIEVDGRDRELITVVPEGYDPNTPNPVVFAFHGRTTPNTQVRRYFGLERAATRPTIVVYPSGLLATDGKFSWYERGESGDALRDYAFFDAMLETIGRAYCLDLDRVFVVGHSLGGSFANSLACARGSVIRGVGTVAGRIWKADCSGPAATMIIHNPHDDLVPISRGIEARDHALEQNGLDSEARPCEPAELRCEWYGSPEAADPVVWCPHTQDVTRSGRTYPHLWPDGAGEAIMAFLEALP
jgi:polyhydroxybutyrate depolymerase